MHTGLARRVAGMGYWNCSAAASALRWDSSGGESVRLRVELVWIVIVVAGVLGWLWWYRQSHWQVAGPRRWPLLGCTLEMVANWGRFHDWLREQFSEESKTIHIAFALHLPNAVFTAEPANVEHVLKTNFANYPKVSMQLSKAHEREGKGVGRMRRQWGVDDMMVHWCAGGDAMRHDAGALRSGHLHHGRGVVEGAAARGELRILVAHATRVQHGRVPGVRRETGRPPRSVCGTSR